MLTIQRESHKAPEWFTEELTRIGGKNRFGGPNFDVVWSECATIERDGQTVLQCPGPPCWLLREWNPPEVYGPPETWDSLDTGEAWPQFGKYEIVQPFRASQVLNGKLVHEPMPLARLILDMVVPIILAARDYTQEKCRLALQEQKEREEKARENKIADALQDAMPAWLGPVSYARQKLRTSLIDKKAHEIQKQWQHAMAFYAKHAKGPSIHNPAVN